MIEFLPIELAKRLKSIRTIDQQKENRIIRYDDKSFFIETDSSREKFLKGEKSEPYDVITYKFILEGWEEFVELRVASAKDFKKVRGRSSFIMALLANLPFVKISKSGNRTIIKINEFQPDDLPSTTYENLRRFLEDVGSEKYDPKELSSLNDDDFRTLAIRARQDSRILGFLDKQNNVNEAYIDGYMMADDKDAFIKNRLIEHEYTKIVLFCLELLSGLSKQQRRRALEELAMIIVRNPLQKNLMMESVAKRRTHNLLKWMENTKLIDDEWRPIENFFEILKQKEPIMSNIRGTLLRIMNDYLTARREDFGGHALGTFVRREVPNEFYNLPFIDSAKYIVTASVGQGNWAAVPWIAIMNKNITDSTQRGYYLCYLFSEDMSSVYLVFMQGVTETSKQEMLNIKSEIRQTIPATSAVNIDDEGIYLGESKRAKEYAFSTAVYKIYDFENMPSEEELVNDLREMVQIYENYISLKNKSEKYEYEQIKFPIDEPGMIANENDKVIMDDKELITHIHSYITSKGYLYDKEDVINLYLSLKTKPFVILSGISGTGKTRIARLFAESVGANDDNGQFTLIPIRPDWHDSSDLLGYRDIKGDFKEGPLTKVIKKAVENPEKPYFVLLDEMNLARVEHYFSDILSVMETRDWQNGEIVTTYLFPKENEADEHDEAWKNLRLPNNLYIIGTVNMDETTHPFSKKVLDRANTIEFNEVDLSNLAFLHKGESVESIPVDNDHFASKYLKLKDIYEQHQELIERTTKELVKINEILKQMYAHVGYRVRDEICLYLVYNAEGELLDEKRALDYCILQKILPRISGSDSRVVNVLKELYKLFTGIQYHEGREVNEDDLSSADYPHSARKVAEMLRRFEYDGFTSFWIS